MISISSLSNLQSSIFFQTLLTSILILINSVLIFYYAQSIMLFSIKIIKITEIFIFSFI